MLNPPPYVALAWSVLARVLPPPVASKIVVVRGNAARVLAQLQAHLPMVRLSGARQTYLLPAHPCL